MSARVTICIPTFNHARYIEAAVRSALAQRWSGGVEVLVMNNASTDATGDILRGMSGAPSLRVLHETEHVGMTANWNRCIRAASGDFVVLLSSDDLLLPGMVERAAAMLEKNPQLAFVHAAFRVIDGEGREVGFQQSFVRDQMFTAEEMLPTFLSRSPVGLVTGMFRRTLWEKVGGFDESYSICQDWQFWLKLLEHGGVGYVAEPGAGYRSHPISTASTVALARERLRLVNFAFQGAELRAGVRRRRVLRSLASSTLTGAADIQQPSDRRALVEIAREMDSGLRTSAEAVAIERGLGSLLARRAQLEVQLRNMAKRLRWRVMRDAARAQGRSA